MPLARKLVSVIGVGGMGAAAARRLIERGFDVRVWNRTDARVEPLIAAGASASPTISEAVAGAAAVVTFLSDRDALREVAFGENGLAENLQPGQTFIEMSTVGPGVVEEIRAALPTGVNVLEAPVLGSRAEASSGELIIFAGGAKEALAGVREILEALGTPIHVGGIGSGAAAKLVANHALLTLVVAVGETIRLADELGLPREVTWDVLARTPLAAQADRRRTAVEAQEWPPRFALRLALKDARLISEAGAGALRLGTAVQEWFEIAASEGLEDSDYTAVLAAMTREPITPVAEDEDG